MYIIWFVPLVFLVYLRLSITNKLPSKQNNKITKPQNNSISRAIFYLKTGLLGLKIKTKL